MQHIPDFFKQSLVKLAGPFWGKPRLASLLFALIRQVQDLEDTIDAVGLAYQIDTADDARLAILGKVVGQSRLGAWDTETYRAVIRGRIRASRSHGRHDDIVEVILLVTQTTEPILVTHLVPATVLVELGEPVDAEHMIALAFLLPKTRAAGVRLNFVTPISGGFSFDSSVAPIVGAGTFDSSVAPIVGAGVFGSANTF